MILILVLFIIITIIIMIIISSSSLSSMRNVTSPFALNVVIKLCFKVFRQSRQFVLVLLVDSGETYGGTGLLVGEGT